MDKNFLIELIDKGLSIRDILKHTDKSYSTIRYWLNEYNLKTKRSQSKINEINNTKMCLICLNEKTSDDFYTNKNKTQSYCKKCSNTYHQNRVKEVKIKMIEYKGNKCENCNLKLENSHYSVFDFHHINPSEKDPNFGRIKFQKWETIKNEIDKCALLCANCHRLEHAKLNGWGKSNRIVKIKIPKIDNYCDCGIKICGTSRRCESCNNKYSSKLNQRKVERPEIDILLKDVSELGYSGTGRKYGVSDNSIRKWIKNY